MPVRSLQHERKRREIRRMQTSNNKIMKLEGELDYRTGKLADAFENLDSRVQALEARLDSLILILRRLETHFPEPGVDPIDEENSESF